MSKIGLSRVIGAVRTSDLDCEHETLHRAIADIYDDMKAAHEMKTVHTLLRELSALVEAHFELEEKLMAYFDHQQHDEHAKAHAELKAQIKSAADMPTDIDDIDAWASKKAGELLEWFHVHDAEHDVHLVATLAKAE